MIVVDDGSYGQSSSLQSTRREGPRSLSFLLLLSLSLWLVLMAVQALCSPFDGYVMSHLNERGADIAWGPIMAKSFFQLVVRFVPPQRIVLIYALLLLAIPSFMAWTIARILGAGTIHRVPSLKRTLVIALIALAVSTVFNLPYLSNDVYLYRLYGEMMDALGVNPYATTPAAHYSHAEIRNVPWVNQYCAYGPLALAFFKIARSLSSGMVFNFWILKLLMGTPWFIVLVGIYFSKHIEEGKKVKCLAWIGLNPLLLLELCQNAHLEGWIGLLFLAITLVLCEVTPRRIAIAGLLFGFVCAIKLSALVAGGAILAYILLWDRSQRLLSTAAFFSFLLFTIVALVTVAACYAPLWIGMHTFAGVRQESLKVIRSLYAILRDYGHMSPVWIQYLSALGTVCACALGAWTYWRRKRLADALVLSLILQAVIGRTFLQPWYFCPLIMIALASGLLGGRKEVSRGATPVSEKTSFVEHFLLITSLAGIVGGYAVLFLARRMSNPVLLASFLCMVLPPLVFGLTNWFRHSKSGFIR